MRPASDFIYIQLSNSRDGGFAFSFAEKTYVDIFYKIWYVYCREKKYYRYCYGE